ncbi:hypothetical protein L210DRAFT_2473261 [Boletus edulis BED1]|uniref:Zn(2)-C6 fungal-type domain-containing protein n=1 Tax=Boletus edulis BED1 TaxID=1328754 RepID=A0AAD4BBF7_BOLED|nr:hypothetical protein L210DRAFT_2473261 [Boletus edulis BED1]
MPLDVDPRSALHGRLDPTTGIFYRAAEHPRIRTAQACNKCRVRKAKCSGERPICERCRIRGIGHAVHSKNDQRIQGMCLMHPSSTEVFNALRDLEPQKNHIVVHDAEHGTFEPTKDSITSEGGEGKGTLNEGDLPTFVVPRFLEGADMSQGRKWCMATDVVLPSLQSSSNRIVFRCFLGRPQHTIELRSIHVLREQRSFPGLDPLADDAD